MAWIRASCAAPRKQPEPAEVRTSECECDFEAREKRLSQRLSPRIAIPQAEALLATYNLLNSNCIISIDDDHLTAREDMIVDDDVHGLFRLSVEFDDAAIGELQDVF
jgi:hypothetical protein